MYVVLFLLNDCKNLWESYSTLFTDTFADAGFRPLKERMEIMVAKKSLKTISEMWTGYSCLEPIMKTVTGIGYDDEPDYDMIISM